MKRFKRQQLYARRQVLVANPDLQLSGKWGGGGGGGTVIRRNLSPVIRGEGAVAKKWSKNKGAEAPPGPSPGSAEVSLKIRTHDKALQIY